MAFTNERVLRSLETKLAAAKMVVDLYQQTLDDLHNELREEDTTSNEVPTKRKYTRRNTTTTNRRPGRPKKTETQTTTQV